MQNHRKTRQLSARTFGGYLLTCLMFLLFLGAPQLKGQTDTARIQGSVTDASGAAIPDAMITVTNTDQGTIFNSTSDSSGNFIVAALPRGNYQAKVQATGFQTVLQNLKLEVSEVQALNFKLVPGSVATTVTVTDAAPIVDLATSSTGLTIQGRQVTELPLNGRNFTTLALLTPGVTRGAYGDGASGVNGDAETFRNKESGGAALSANGLRPQTNNFILDGIDNNESLVNTLEFFPPVEATEEFRVNTSVAPAEFGRAGGAVIQTSIKSGGNEIHGSLFEFHRNSAFDANPNYQFNGASHTPALPFKRNQFGASLGGPILRDKLFIFGDYAGLRQDQPLNPDYVTVPTALMRQGNFSELLTARQSCNGSNLPLTSKYGTDSFDCSQRTANGEIYDPTTGAQFAGNIIPASRLNKAAVNYLNAYPLPNIPGNANGLLQNYRTIRRDITHYNDFDVRLDYALNAKNLLFARFSYDNSEFNRTSRFTNLPAGFASGANTTHGRGYALGYTRTFTPNIVNELRAGYVRYTFTNAPVMSGIPVSANLGIVNANRNSNLGGGALIGGWGNELEYTGDYGTYAVPENTYEINDALSWIRGHHTFKFGSSAIRRDVAFFRPIDGKGQFMIGNGTGRYTGYEVSELLAGFMDTYTIGSQDGFFGTRNYELGMFGQDDWKITNRLTVNLGIRYDIYTYPYEEHNRQAAFDIATSTIRLAGQNGNSRSLIDTYYGNFAPRIGFAYDIYGNSKTVLRGGYGIFYFQERGGINNQFGQQAPYGGSTSYLAQNGYRVTFTGQAPKGSGYTGSLDNTLATNALPAPGYPSFDPNNPPQGTNVLATKTSNRPSMVQQWNLQVEQQLDKATVVDIAYVGTKTDHIVTYYPYNFYHFGTGLQNLPNLGTVTWQLTNAVAHYSGLQVQVKRQATRGLQVTGAYSWSHTLDNAGGDLFYYNTALARGNSSQDQRNVFTMSMLYDLPFGRGRSFGANIPRALDYAVGGWQFNTITQLATGTPFDIEAGGNPNTRADLVGVPRVTHSIVNTFFDTTAFKTPPSVSANGQTVWTRPGTFGRNQLAGPGTKTVDISLFKSIPITERLKTELRGEAFNSLNTPQFTNPDGNVYDGNFGKVTGTRQSSERQIQLAVRFLF